MKEVSNSILRAYSDEELEEIFRSIKHDHARNLKGGYMALAGGTGKSLSIVLNEVDRREALRIRKIEEEEKWDEWGNYIGPTVIPWWKSRKFWFSWR